jgi:hypothetical protein
MIDLKVASLRAHGNNIRRYRRLLRTDLSDLERQLIERRLNEEKLAMEHLASTRFSITLTLSNPTPENAAFGAAVSLRPTFVTVAYWHV